VSEFLVWQPPGRTGICTRTARAAAARPTEVYVRDGWSVGTATVRYRDGRTEGAVAITDPDGSTVVVGGRVYRYTARLTRAGMDAVVWGCSGMIRTRPRSAAPATPAAAAGWVMMRGIHALASAREPLDPYYVSANLAPFVAAGWDVSDALGWTPWGGRGSFHPTHAAAWKAGGWTSADVQPLLSVLGRDHNAAVAWADSGLDPADAAVAVAAGLGPREAREAYDTDPTVVERWPMLSALRQAAAN
jgi:hypothetical protein